MDACKDRDHFSSLLRSAGLKVTLPRLRILRVFRERGTKHLSAEDIYLSLADAKDSVGLATVYRVLMQFAEAGIVSRRHFETDGAVFELNDGNHHDHLICRVCGKIEEFVDNEIERRQEDLAKKYGFALQAHSMSIYGVCRDCNTSKAA